MDYTQQDLIDLYKFAWEKHDLVTLDKIFSTDVEYQEKPNNIFKGIKELKGYWLDNSLKQQDVCFNAKKCIFYGNDVIIDWSASFYHLKKEKNINLQGIMWWILSEGKIINLKEFFNIVEDE